VSSTVDTTTAGSMTVVSPSPTATMQRSPVSGRGGPTAAAPPLQPAPAEPRKKGIMLLRESTGLELINKCHDEHALIIKPHGGHWARCTPNRGFSVSHSTTNAAREFLNDTASRASEMILVLLHFVICPRAVLWGGSQVRRISCVRLAAKESLSEHRCRR
jgi:hypothetical protein